MAKTGLDVLIDESFASAVRREFEREDMTIALDPWVA